MRYHLPMRVEPSAVSGTLATLRRRALALAPLLPCLIYLAWLAGTWEPWIWVHNYGDPDFGYWLNALQILGGFSPTHIDHPGTPVQLLGAMVLLSRYHLAGIEPDLVADFFAHPLGYHVAYVSIVVPCLVMAQWHCGRRLRALGYGIVLTWLVQLIPFFVFDAVIYSFQITPEAWIVVVYYLWIPLLVEVTSTRHCDDPTAIAIGTLFGLLVSLKLHTATAFPLLLLLPGWRNRLSAAAAALFFFVCVTAPLWPEYPRLFEWALGLLFARREHGTGGFGIPEPSWLWSNWDNIWIQGYARPMQIAVLALPVLAALAYRKRIAVFGILSGGSLLCCALVLKQAQGSRYFLILVPYLSLSLTGSNGLPVRPLWNSLYLAGILLLFVQAPESIRKISSLRRQLGETETELRPYLDRKYASCIYLTEHTSLQETGLQGGNNAALASLFSPALTRLFPRFLAYFPDSQTAYGFNGVVKPDARGLYGTERYPCEIAVFFRAQAVSLPREALKNLVPLEITSGGTFQIYGDRFSFDPNRSHGLPGAQRAGP